MLSIIQDSQVPQLKKVRSLSRRSARYRSELFIVEGHQIVYEALCAHKAGAKKVVKAIYFIADSQISYISLLELAVQLNISLRPVTREVFLTLSDTESPQGILAICNFLAVSLDSVIAKSPKLLAILAEVRDPGNAGTLLRAADAAGADSVIFTASSVDLYNPKTLRSTMGSIFHIPVVIGVELLKIIDVLKKSQIQILAADGAADLTIDDLLDAMYDSSESSFYDLRERTAWIFGNESQGISEEVFANVDTRVAVPLYGKAESLNVATAATVCLYSSARAHR